MKGWLGSLLKLAFVAGLMFYVFRSIHFEDRLVLRSGETVVADAHHIDRGYQDFAGKLRAIGADVTRVED